MVVHRHEDGVHHNAESDEQLHERIEHYERDKFLNADPTPAAVPDAENVDTLETGGDAAFLQSWATPLGVVSAVCGEIID